MKIKMNELTKFITVAYKGTRLVAPIASGVTPVHCHGDQCQCDCSECAGGDTSDD